MSDKECKELCKLIDINEDACEFYESAQTKTTNSTLKTTFKELESLHSGVVANIQRLVREKGDDAEADETLRGQMNQFWGELMTKISDNPDDMLVYQLEEAEDRCVKSMREALDSDDLSTQTKAFLQNEMTTLNKSHDYMRSLKNSLKTAA